MVGTIRASILITGLMFASLSQAQEAPICMSAALMGEQGIMELTVEIVQSQEEISLGLMNRESMPLNHGMLFLFQDEDRHAFWMKNTLIPLDIVPLLDDGFVQEVMDGVPHSLDLLTPSAPIRRVLELNRGVIETMGAQSPKGRLILKNGTECPE